MLKKTVEYVDYNGDKRKEDFYFNLTKAELAEMQLSTDGGYGERLQRIVDANDVPTLIKEFKQIVLMSYGEKSDDGRRFVKSDEIRTAFSQTEAYSEIFMELATDDKAASDFINAVIPKEMSADPEHPALK